MIDVKGPSKFSGSVDQRATDVFKMGTAKIQFFEPRDAKTSTLGTKGKPFPKIFLASTHSFYIRLDCELRLHVYIAILIMIIIKLLKFAIISV